MYEMDQYQWDALSVSTDGDNHHTDLYLLTGIISELGEVASLLERECRKKEILDSHAMELELGDVLWYLSTLAARLGFSLSGIARANIEKLTKRGEENK